MAQEVDIILVYRRTLLIFGSIASESVFTKPGYYSSEHWILL